MLAVLGPRRARRKRSRTSSSSATRTRSCSCWGKRASRPRSRRTRPRAISASTWWCRRTKRDGAGRPPDAQPPKTKADDTSAMFKEGGMIPTNEQQRAKREVGIRGDIVNALRAVPRVVDVQANVTIPEDSPLRDVNEAKPKAEGVGDRRVPGGRRRKSADLHRRRAALRASQLAGDQERRSLGEHVRAEQRSRRRAHGRRDGRDHGRRAHGRSPRRAVWSGRR